MRSLTYFNLCKGFNSIPAFWSLFKEFRETPDLVTPTGAQQQQQGNFTLGLQPGEAGTGICVPREGFLLPVMPWLPLGLFAQGWILEAARFCWEFWNSSAIRLKKKKKSCSALSGSFLLLYGGGFVLGFTAVFFRFFGCGLLSSQSSVTLTLQELLFHGRAF